MGFRSRALLTGVATGFLKAQNDRRDKMAERLQQLSDNRALMDRERAKSEYAEATKAAAKEKMEWARAMEAKEIDADGNYTQLYYDKVATTAFADPNIQKAYGGKGFDAFKAEWQKLQPKKMTRQFKDASEISGDMSRVLDSIDTRQRHELSQPVMTGLDSFLASGVNRVKSAVGMEPSVPQEVPQDTAPATLNPYADVQPSAPAEPYVAPNFTPVTEPVKPDSVNQLVTAANGDIYAVFTDSTGKRMETKLSFKGKSEGGDDVGLGKMGTEKVRIFDPSTQQFFKEDTHRDIATGAVRVGRDWVDIPEGMVAVPADIKIDPIKFPDPVTGEVMTVQAYRNVTGGVGKNDITMEDGTSWTPISKPVPYTDQNGNKVQTKKLPPVIKTDLEEFNRQHKTVTLVDELIRANYVSNPVSWAQKNLSVITDTIAASVGYTGEDKKDIDAIVAYANNEMTASGLKDSIGALDAAAVRAGEKDAIQALLTFALADSQKSGDRLSNQDVENAKAVVDPLVSGTASHRGALLSVRSLAEKRVSTVVGQHLNLAMGQGPTSELWDYYRSAKMQVDKGLTPVAEVFEGQRLIDKIKSLETTNPTAYAQTIKYLTADRGIGTKWEEVLKRPVRVDTATGVVFLPFYRETNDGAIRVGIYKAK